MKEYTYQNIHLEPAKPGRVSFVYKSAGVCMKQTLYHDPSWTHVRNVREYLTNIKRRGSSALFYISDFRS